MSDRDDYFRYGHLKPESMAKKLYISLEKAQAIIARFKNKRDYTAYGTNEIVRGTEEYEAWHYAMNPITDRDD